MFIKRPEISIILLTHNRPDGLKAAVKSVYAQTFKNFELIILDNGSTLDYPDVLADYFLSKDNLHYLKFEENEEYLGKRLNQGLAISNGKYIAFLMDDDTLEKNALKYLYEEISKNLDFVYGRVKSIDYISGKSMPNSYGRGTWRKNTLKKINPIHITSVLIKRNLINMVGGFHEKLKRSYDLDLWNRIFKEAKCSKIDKIISHISVNDLTSVTGRNEIDLNSHPAEYPLIGYWSNRKSISFLNHDRQFIDQINQRNQSWVATHCSLETDVTVSGVYSDVIQKFDGDFFYYIDHPKFFQDWMWDRCDAVITPFQVNTQKHHHLLRPTISQKTLKQVDNRVYQYQKNLRVLCPKITADNLDFIYDLMDYVADRPRYSAILFYYFQDNEVRSRLNKISNLIPMELQGDSYDYFKQMSIDVILHIDRDINSYSNSYKDAYNSFLISSAIRAPLVTSPNIAYSNILKHDEDLYIVDTLQKFVASIDKAKDIFTRENMIKKIRKKTYLYFLDKIVLDKFILFLNENHKIVSRKTKGSVLIEQLNANSSVVMHSREILSQSFLLKEVSFNGIQFFGESLNNISSYLKFTLKCEDSILREEIIPNYKLKNGVNTILFEEVKDVPNKKFSFTLQGEVPIFKVDYSNAVRSTCPFYRNGVPKKACLKFRVLKDAMI